MQRIPPARRFAGVVVLVAAVVTACGGTPDRADFAKKIKSTIGADLIASMNDAGVPTATAERIVDRFVDCQYDSIKDVDDLLDKTYDNPSDSEIVPQLDAATEECRNELTRTLEKSIDPSRVTTTTTIPLDLPVPTFPTDATSTSGATLDTITTTTAPGESSVALEPTTTAG